MPILKVGPLKIGEVKSVAQQHTESKEKRIMDETVLKAGQGSRKAGRGGPAGKTRRDRAYSPERLFAQFLSPWRSWSWSQVEKGRERLLGVTVVVPSSLAMGAVSCRL